ncbi:uncharacterized protein STEHIDRAFT_91464 [Stereum hirsutum FP-91666 SS1]|uniref:uncharacterized protein n=1 Tax=Stereum hirsutum (strain FP-91666) TaxID=721885 RepID=UPI000440FE22|nr:uncharacterized protein STEHIDRAFT_91464 [Stereum hirsutum FP-91666 SS1]EIM91368.1 hypothetical protein STEHIDRAFT_91464 [Stereum hirsutum FP-91666 SS1]
MSFTTGSSLFGSTSQQPQQQGNLFGSTQPNTPNQQPNTTQSTPNLFGGQQPAAGGLFGNTAPKPAGSLFGNTTTNTQTQPAAGGLFGNTNTQTLPPGSLFGNPSTNTNTQPTTGGSLFGNLNSSTNTASTQPASGGLFGNTTQPATGGSLFGNQGANQAQTQPATGGLFGNTNTNQAAQGTGGSLFGNTQNSGGGLFGNKPATTGGSLFGQQPQQNTGLGGSLFGQPQQQQQQQQQQPQQSGGLFGSTLGGSSLFGGSKPQNTLGLSTLQPPPPQSSPIGSVPFTKSTKFNDLPDNLKQAFEQIESHIQGRVQISQDLKQRKVGEEALKGQDIIRSVHKDLVNCITTLQNDVLTTRDLKAKVDQTVQDTIIAIQIVQGHQNQQVHGEFLKNHAGFPLEFFTRITEEMQRRLQWYKTTMEQIERKLASTASRAQYTPQVINSTLQAQHDSFMALANRVASINADVQRIKAIYTQLWRQKTGSMRDPFNELDRGSGGDFGLEGIYGK